MGVSTCGPHHNLTHTYGVLPSGRFTNWRKRFWKAEQSSERVVESPVAEPKPRPVPRTGAAVGGTTTEGEEELGAVNAEDSEEELEVIDVDSE